MISVSAASSASTVPRSIASPFRILVLPGDGIGQEVVPAAVRVLQATGLPFELVYGEAGWGCFERYGSSLPNETLAAAHAADAILFGAVSSPSHTAAGYRSPIIALRRALDLYANIRPVTTDHRPPTTDCQARTMSVVGRRSSVVDLVVVRENTEGLYAGRERLEDGGDTAVAERVITRRASERIVRTAFELARSRPPTTDHRPPTTDEPASTFSVQRSAFPKVTIVHKANVLRVSDGLFRETALRVAAEYPDVATDELLVDNAALQLVQRPERFDVIVTTNLFGDILSDVASYWCGGLGMATSANIGERQALFEPVHGSAPDIAGQGIANPLAAIGCAAMLLDYLGRPPTADHRPPTAEELPAVFEYCRAWATRVRTAIRTVLASGVRTPDLGGDARTEEVTDAIIASMTDHV
jgi:homoisocitrate dehydrogenase